MKPYYETELGKLYHGDCLEIISQLMEKVDMVLTSPPYDNLRNYKGYSFDFHAIADALYTSMTAGGVIVWVVGDQTVNGSETGTSFRQALYFKEIGFNLHDTMIYQSHKPPLTHNRYEQSFEYMFVLSKGKPNVFNPILKKNIHFGANGLRNGEWAAGKDNSAIRQRDGVNFIKEYGIISNIWSYKTGGNNSATDSIAFQHPAVFPEKLAQDHIKSWTNHGDLVLDCFMGSGTTAIACERLGRRWIGIEISKEYCDIAVKRIERERSQNSLFTPQEIS